MNLNALRYFVQNLIGGWVERLKRPELCYIETAVEDIIKEDGKVIVC